MGSSGNKLHMLMYSALGVGGFVAWFYIQNANSKVTKEQLYEKYGASQRLVEERMRNERVMAKIKASAGIVDETTVRHMEPRIKPIDRDSVRVLSYKRNVQDDRKKNDALIAKIKKEAGMSDDSQKNSDSN